MRELARSENYNVEQLQSDCTALHTAFYGGSVMMEGSANERAALDLVQKHLETLVSRLESSLGIVVTRSSGMRSSDPSFVGQGEQAASETQRQEMEMFVQAFIPTLDYDTPGRSQPFEDPLIFVSNFQSLKERVSSATSAPLQVCIPHYSAAA